MYNHVHVYVLLGNCTLFYYTFYITAITMIITEKSVFFNVAKWLYTFWHLLCPMSCSVVCFYHLITFFSHIDSLVCLNNIPHRFCYSKNCNGALPNISMWPKEFSHIFINYYFRDIFNCTLFLLQQSHW